jgi:hypothetical protein
MSERKIKPSRWYYVVALLIPFFACVGTALFVYTNVPKLPGALEGMGINDLTQVVVPGSTDVHFPKAGGYAVYYEYRSVNDGVSYARNKFPPSIQCQLTSKSTGEDIAVTPDYVEGNMYATQNEERVGVLINSIVIKNPGIYHFSCQYPDGRKSPEIVLAVGPNIIWEFFNIAAKPIAATLTGGLVFAGAGMISILILVFVAIKRHESKKMLVL